MVEPGSRERLREAMERAGMTAADLIKASGVGGNVIYRYVRRGFDQNQSYQKRCQDSRGAERYTALADCRQEGSLDG